MRARAIKALNRLGDAELFSAVAEGMALVVKHGDHLWNAATTLYDTGQHHAARILALIVEEEAAKYLILIDAIRCPRLPQDRRACQLGRFNEHLAKGLYAEAAQMRPSDLRQLQEYLNPYRHELYLDGPNDVDWIFRNEIIEERESSLYVDYVEGNDGLYWSDPTVRAALAKPHAAAAAAYADHRAPASAGRCRHKPSPCRHRWLLARECAHSGHNLGENQKGQLPDTCTARRAWPSD